MLAAVAACGEGAALSHRTAAAAPSIIRWGDRHPDVIVLGENPPRHPRINGHRTACLPPEHVTTWRGIPITTPERTLLDLAGVLNHDQLRRAIRQSQFLGLTTLGSLVAALRGPGPSDAFQRALDRERQAILEAHGYRVLRVTWAQAIAQPGRTLRRFCERSIVQPHAEQLTARFRDRDARCRSKGG